MVREESLKLIESLRKALSGGFLKQTIPRFQILCNTKQYILFLIFSKKIKISWRKRMWKNFNFKFGNLLGKK